MYELFIFQIGAASRIPGMTPAAIVALLKYVKYKHNHVEGWCKLTDT